MSTQSANTLECRLLALERAFTVLSAREGAVEARLGQDEQQIAKLGAQQGWKAPSGVGNVSPATVGAGGLSASAAGTPGSGSVTIQILSGGSLTGGATVTCYNLFPLAIAASSSIMAGEDSSGNWWLLNIYCP
jgi:hypothetical protein